jgi:farnesol dehydrogenase
VKILVTGGTGYLGRAVVRALADRGHDLVLFARSASACGLSGSAIDGDVRDKAALVRAADRCDAICHMAALVSIWRRRRRDFDDVNVGGLANVLAAAAAAGVSRVVYTSSFLALPPAGGSRTLAANDYQRTKVAADRLADHALAEGAPVVRLYPGVVYGPGPPTEGNLVGRLVADHLRRRLPGLIGPERAWSFAYVDDVASGHVAAVERGQIGGRYMLGGVNATQQTLFEIVQQITGRRPPRRIPFPVADALGTLEEWRVRLLGGTPLVTRGTVEIFRHDWTLDSSAAAAALGYTVSPLEPGVARTIASIEGSAER